MSKSIQFQESTELIRGQEVPIKIVIDLDKPTKVRGIHASFHAAEKTKATYRVTTSNGKETRTETRTATEYHDIVKESFLLFGSKRMGFFARLSDSLKTWFGGGTHEVMEPGPQEFSLNLKIPEDAPASFLGEKCEVFYRLNVQVDLPIRLNWSKNQSLEVGAKQLPQDIAPVHAVFPDELGRSFWDRTFGKNVILNLAIDRDIHSVGETSMAMLTVETPEPLQLTEISADLVGTESVTANGHTDSYGHRYPLQEIDSPNVISEESVHEFDIQIPEIDAPFTHSGKNFAVKWQIEVQLEVPWAKNPIISLPIILIPRGRTFPGS
ncbi:hypothetical protein N9B54_02735 [Mariniblastus sp.]|nr:hypothetical protein [Mariniblastus sp.]MDB4545032.1 hypothetical protein [bacterium]